MMTSRKSRVSLLYLLIFVPCFCFAQLQQLLSTLQQNPALLSTLQSNPELLRSLLSSTGGLSQPPVSHQPVSQFEDECSAIKKQNKLLRNMVLSVAGEDSLNQLDILAPVNRRDKLLDPAAALLLNQKQIVQSPAQPSISLKSELVTPPATWTTSMTTTSYVTTVTHTETSEVPIILRGKKVVTTILEENTQVVTATEIKTSSILVTPEPTWKIETVTIQPTHTQQPISPLLLQTSAIPDQKFFLPETIKTFNPRKRNNVQKAQVIEIDDDPQDFKAAYGAFFANSAQRTANRFGDILRPVRNPLKDFDYYDDFDQQGLAAQDRPVFVNAPSPKSRRKTKIFTLYFSGTAPGDFSTKVTRLAVDHAGQPILSRNKREDISPSKVQPILSTMGPWLNELDSTLEKSQENNIFNLFSSVEDLQSSIVTVTETVTKTVTDYCSK